MTDKPSILCIGSVLWDIIGRSTRHMQAGSDVPGRITRLPGGVALNIAMTLSRFGVTPALLSVVGRDDAGNELIRALQNMSLNIDYLYRSTDLPTDQYMAVEGSNGLIAAIADAHSLEAAGAKILAALSDGRLGTQGAPFQGTIALDGNLTVELLSEIARSDAFARADLRVAPASPGKAERLIPLLSHPTATLYVNLEEASLICKASFTSADLAAQAMIARGASRVLVTDGGNMAAEATADNIVTATPPRVMVTRVTGAGDTFMAAHIVAELQGDDRQASLEKALRTAANYVSGKSE